MPPETQEPSAPAAVKPAAPPPETESDPVTQTLALLQPWIDYVPQRQRWLGLFLVLALLIHLSAFFFIRIDTTRAESWHQPRPHVSVESPSMPSLINQVTGDTFWDRLTDPRLFLFPTQTAGSQFSSEPAVDFTAINSNIGTGELPSSALPSDYQFVRPVIPPLEQRVQDAMHPPRQSFTYETTPAPIAAKTTWQWGDVLAKRQPSGMIDLPSPISDTELAPTQLNVGVSPDGTVQYAMADLLEKSSEGGIGRLDLDQLAITAVRKVRFRPVDQTGLTWGRVTIFWHYSANPRVEVVPTPPSGP